MADNVITGKVRLSWPTLFEPKAYEDNPPKFSTMILIPKSDKATIDKLRKAEKDTAQEQKSKFDGGKVPPKPGSIIHDGDGENKYGTPWAEKYPEREGHWFMTVSANAEYPPGVVDGKLNAILDKTEIYSGVYARVALRPFAFNSNGNQGVSFGLQSVQKIADGEPFAGRASAADVFDVIDDDDLI